METQSRALAAAAGLKPKIITLYPNLLARLFPRMARFPFGHFGRVTARCRAGRFRI